MSYLAASPTISVVVPARNEEGTIAQVVARSFAVFEGLAVGEKCSWWTTAPTAQNSRRWRALRRPDGVYAAQPGHDRGVAAYVCGRYGDIVILIPADMGRIRQ